MKLLKSEAEREVIRIFVKESSKQQVLMRLEEFVETSREYKILLDVSLLLMFLVQPNYFLIEKSFTTC